MFEKIEDVTLDDKQKCEAIKNLIAKNPKLIDFKDKKTGTTALHLAVSKNLFLVAKLLLDSGISVNVVDEEGKTPLHIAAIKDCDQMIVFLNFQPKCDFNAVDKLGQTALHKAIINAKERSVKNLVHIGKTNINIADAKGFTAEHYLNKNLNLKQQITLSSAYKFDNMFKRTLLQRAVVNESPDLVINYLSWGASPNDTDNQGRTALHLAAINGNGVILLALCRIENMDFDKVDNEGNTALHYAVLKGHRACAKTLLTTKVTTAKQIKNKERKLPVDLIDNSANTEESRLFKELLSGSQQKQFDPDFFGFAEKDHESEKYQVFLKKHLPDLQFSRDTEDSAKQSLYSSESKSGQAKNSFKKYYTSSDIKDAVKKIKKSTNDPAACIEQLRLRKFDNDLSRISFLSALVELQAERLTEFNQQSNKIKSSVCRSLEVDGLKPMYKRQEINELSDESYSEILNPNSKIYSRILSLYKTEELAKEKEDDLDEKLIKIKEQLKKITNICSGDKQYYEAVINREQMLTQVLGLLDFIEPPEFILYLTELHPYFSTAQQLQAQYILCALILEFYDLFGFDPAEHALFIEQIELYFNTANKQEIKNELLQHIKLCSDFNNHPINVIVRHIQLEIEQQKMKHIRLEMAQQKINKIELGIKEQKMRPDQLIIEQQKIAQIKLEIEQLKPLVSQKDKSWFGDQIDEYVRSKSDKIVLRIAREINLHNAIVYKNISLKAFRHEFWNGGELLKNNESMNAFLAAIEEAVRSYSTPQKQAAVISLFILVAQESLHFKIQGINVPDLTAASTLTAISAFTKLDEAFKLVDKDVLKIQANLENLFFPPGNSLYWDLEKSTVSSLSAVSSIISKKTSIYEVGQTLESVEFLGGIYKKLIVFKQRLLKTNLNHEILSAVKDSVTLENPFIETRVDAEPVLTPIKLSKQDSKKEKMPNKIAFKNGKESDENSSLHSSSSSDRKSPKTKDSVEYTTKSTSTTKVSESRNALFGKSGKDSDKSNRKSNGFNLS